jgi:cytoskeleton protein RodZ
MQTIGERLEEARKKKGISIREAAEATKIRGDYLQKFESNHFDIGLTEIYTRGFLRTYANFLKVPAERLLSDYAALGRAELRPRQPAREVYGRMDISVATASDPAERAAPENGAAADGTGRPQPRYPRGSSPLPSGPDPAVVFKYLKWGGIAVIVLLAALVIKTLFSGGVAGAPKAAGARTAADERSITLFAVGPVRVAVHAKNPDGTEGPQLFTGRLNAGESKIVPRRGALFVEGSPPENLDIGIDGRRFNLSRAIAGQSRGELPPPN